MGFGAFGLGGCGCCGGCDNDYETEYTDDFEGTTDPGWEDILTSGGIGRLEKRWWVFRSDSLFKAAIFAHLAGHTVGDFVQLTHQA
jgi:hypothetical protein